jgi:hypothetical protein
MVSFQLVRRAEISRRQPTIFVAEVLTTSTIKVVKGEGE